MRVEIEIPNYQVKSRNKTATRHWRIYKRHRDEFAELVYGYCMGKNIKTFEKPVTVIIKTYFKGKRHVDTSNYDDKIALDSLMKAGVVKDDNAYHNPIVIKQCFPESGENKVIIIVDDRMYPTA